MPTERLDATGTRTDLVIQRTSIQGGAASRQAAVSDGSDATYIRRSNAGSPIVAFTLGNATRVGYPAEVRTVARSASYIIASGGADSLEGRMGLGRQSGSSLQQSPMNGQKRGSVISTRTFGTHKSRVQGGSWTWDDIDDMLLLLDDDVRWDVGLNWYEAYVNVYSVVPATCSPAIVGTDPATSSYPEFDITVSSVVETWQANTVHLSNMVQVRVFTDVVAGQPGFDPRTSTEFIASDEVSRHINEYIDGTTPSTSVVRWKPSTPLPASGDFRLYAWSKRGNGPEGDVSYVTFGMNVTPSTPPSFDHIEADSGYGLIEVTVDLTPSATHTDPKLAGLQRSVDGVTWEDVSLRYYGDLPGSIAILDFHAPRGVPVRYRAKMQTVKDGVRLVTGWSTASTEHTVDTSGWWFRMLDAQSRGADGEWVYSTPLYARSLRVVGHPETERGEDIAVFRPEGRVMPVVMHGSLQGSDGSYDITTDTEAEWLALQAVLDCQKPVYVDTGFNDSKWVTFLPYRVRRLGTPTSPRRETSVPYVESAPLDELPYPAFEE